MQEQSEQINDLAAALVEAQKQLTTVAKTHAVRAGQMNYTFANLADLWDVAREPLTANGLCVLQLPTMTEKGLVLVTKLCHKGGQWVASSLPIEPTQRTPQALGSAITYARRYAFGAIIGLVSDEDDDGAKASKPVPARERAKAPANEAPAQRAPSSIDSDVEALVRFRERVNLATTPGGVAEVMAEAKARLTSEAYESLRPVGENARKRLKGIAA